MDTHNTELTPAQQAVYDRLGKNDRFLHCDQPYEREAAEIRLRLEARNMDAENPTPEKNNLARPLVDDLRGALTYDPDEDEESVLRHHARALDNAFRRLMSNADVTYENSERCDFVFAQYAAAFKAQDQYRRTVRSLNMLKPKKK